MDPAYPKTPTKKRLVSWFDSVKSKFSPSKSTPGDENASPKDSGSKKSIRRRFTDSIRIQISPKRNTKHQETIMERPSSTSPCKSIRITDKHVSKRKSLSSLLSRTIGSHKMRDSLEPGSPTHVIYSGEMNNSQHAKASDLSPEVEIVGIDPAIEGVVAKMTDNRYFSSRFWETVSAGEQLLRMPKPYKLLRDIPSEDDLSSSDVDRYLEESIDLRTPRQPRPSSHRLRYVSTAAVRVKFPGSGHMEVYASKDKAIADLYEKSSQLADYALWDPVTRIFEAYPVGQEIFPALSGEELARTQYIWLPINSWSGPQNPPTNPPATIRSVENDSFKENEPFINTFVDDYASGSDETLKMECLENDESLKIHSVDDESPKKEHLESVSFKGNGSSTGCPRGTGCEAPPPSPHGFEAENESSKADLSEDEFGLDFEPDSDMDQAICESESLEENEPLAKSLRIRDIVRPESIASSWDIPSDESRIGSPTPTWKDLERKYATAERSISQASTVLESPESSERLRQGMSACEVAMAAVAKDAFNIDSKVWDGVYWHEILACGMAADSLNIPDLGKDIEIVAAVDHVEHVSTPSDLETYFQPGEILQTKRTVGYEPGGVCPYTSLCCHFHDAYGRILTLRCPHPRLMDSGCCHDHETSKSFIENEQLGNCIIRVLLAASPASQLFGEHEQSAEEALLILDDILRITTAQEAEENIVESLGLTEVFDVGNRDFSNASYSSGFKFSAYGYVLEENSDCSTGQNEPDRTTAPHKVNSSPGESDPECTVVLEKVNHSPGKNESNRTALAVLKDLNIRPVGKAATPRKNVRALVDIFQARDLMPGSSPILQSNSRIATPPPRFQRSNDLGSELGMEILNVREFVNDWRKARPGSAASNADTDVSSKFGEALERFGVPAEKENH